ncbi:DUF2059 domain-containing protein [Roseibacillus persicicus]|uniref:DUF2059 domain-containing protein n=1 Tax=Roseibacillus persicicus TaxID=454148 RepID=A0A918WMQ5_9BACT|nr:DUF2059 domain-containing protein [Roseibacillus persicicus]MDQ8189607.1 DUF2059 domain-containing protein [Roseibacillus persicicus]GHC59445.1 hypothetical protein GCM10007100_28270 [Roseibacillus persicicus]
MKALIASTTLALLTAFSSAQEANEESLAAAAKLIETMEVRQEMATGFKAAMEPMLQPMIQQLGLNPEQVAELNEIFTSWWEEDVDQEAVIEKFKNVYAETFTAEELTELELFYQTPLGKKMLHLMPELTQKGMQIGMEAAQAKQPELMAKMKAFEEKVSKQKAPAEEAPAE